MLSESSTNDAIAALHDAVDQAVAPLEQQHRDRLQCRRGCTACCVDDLTVFEVEAARIQRHHGDLLREGKAGPVGACAFLDAEGACRIYAHRPYVCRTQGLPLRWLDPDTSPPTEWRDICTLNEAGPPIAELAAEACWLLGPYEGQLAMLQAREDGGALRRVALRALFA